MPEVLADVVVAHGAESHGTPDPAEQGCTMLVHHCGCHSVAGTVRETSFDVASRRLMAPPEFVVSQPRGEPEARALLRPPAR